MFRVYTTFVYEINQISRKIIHNFAIQPPIYRPFIDSIIILTFLWLLEVV